MSVFIREWQLYLVPVFVIRYHRRRIVISVLAVDFDKTKARPETVFFVKLGNKGIVNQRLEPDFAITPLHTAKNPFLAFFLLRNTQNDIVPVFDKKHTVLPGTDFEIFESQRVAEPQRINLFDFQILIQPNDCSLIQNPYSRVLMLLVEIRVRVIHIDKQKQRVLKNAAVVDFYLAEIRDVARYFIRISANLSQSLPVAENVEIKLLKIGF